MKKLIFSLLCLFSISCFAVDIANSKLKESCVGDCPRAFETNHPEFCGSFVTASRCQCTARGVPAGMCQDVSKIYQRMVDFYGSIQNACKAQTVVSAQECIDDWNCYLYGGRDSKNRPCSATGKSCR